MSRLKMGKRKNRHNQAISSILQKHSSAHYLLQQPDLCFLDKYKTTNIKD